MPKIGVLLPHQAVTDEPEKFETRSQAFRRVRRGWADKITEYLIRLRTERAIEVLTEEILSFRSLYIPTKMPPRGVAGVSLIFQLPTSEAWLLAHRSVTFMPREV
jgi:hypothetical protein